MVGVGGKMLIRGSHLGSDLNAVVVFGNVVATNIERHNPTEIVVRVPVGAANSCHVVRGLNGHHVRALQEDLDKLYGLGTTADRLRRSAEANELQNLLPQAASSGDASVIIVSAFVQGKPSGLLRYQPREIGYVGNRIMVDLKDFLSFDTAISVAHRVDAKLIGYIPVTNTYVLELRNPPSSLRTLDAIESLIADDARVSEVCKDMALETKQVKFADTDWVDRYKHSETASLSGREDAWPMDRVQAPGAWNLLERFLAGGRGDMGSDDEASPFRVAVVDSGCDQTHPDFTGVKLKKLDFADWYRFRIAGDEIILPAAPAELDYDLGDSASQHGTAVTSIIGAANGNTVNGATGDRGVNGLLHNPMKYRIQIYRTSLISEADGDWTTVSFFLVAINLAAVEHAKVLSASQGQPYPIKEDGTSAHEGEVHASLRKLARQMNHFTGLLLVVAAGNEADRGDTEGMHGLVTPYVDRFTPGNYVAASLGALANVITVGAIGRQDQRASFSNWGDPVRLSAPGDEYFVAGVNGGSPFLIGGSSYGFTAGTSFATPTVTGSAGLLFATPLNGGAALSPADVKTRLIGSAFPVNTVDETAGHAVLPWNTMKTGYAVRKLLLDRGYFGADTTNSGVSKVLRNYSGTVGLLDIRRAADGRAEGFAWRTLATASTGSSPALTQNGWGAAYYFAGIDGIGVKSYDFKTGSESTVVAADDVRQGALEFSPSGQLAYVQYFPHHGAPYFEVKLLLVGGTVLADGIWDPTGFFGGLAYKLWHVAWRPDGHPIGSGAPGETWDLDYMYLKPDAPHRWWLPDNPLPGPPVSITPVGPADLRMPCWAPDGRGRAVTKLAAGPFPLDASDTLVTKFYGPGHGFMFEHSAPIGFFVPDAYGHGSMKWSPDGSELAFAWEPSDSSSGKLYTIRRDFRDVGDRSLSTAYTWTTSGSQGAFSWSW